MPTLAAELCRADSDLAQEFLNPPPEYQELVTATGKALAGMELTDLRDFNVRIGQLSKAACKSHDPATQLIYSLATMGLMGSLRALAKAATIRRENRGKR